MRAVNGKREDPAAQIHQPSTGTGGIEREWINNQLRGPGKRSRAHPMVHGTFVTYPRMNE